MKNLFLLTFSALILFSCAQNEEFLPPCDSPTVKTRATEGDLRLNQMIYEFIPIPYKTNIRFRSSWINDSRKDEVKGVAVWAKSALSDGYFYRFYMGVNPLDFAIPTDDWEHELLYFMVEPLYSSSANFGNTSNGFWQTWGTKPIFLEDYSNPTYGMVEFIGDYPDFYNGYVWINDIGPIFRENSNSMAYGRAFCIPIHRGIGNQFVPPVELTIKTFSGSGNLDRVINKTYNIIENDGGTYLIR